MKNLDWNDLLTGLNGWLNLNVGFHHQVYQKAERGFIAAGIFSTRYLETVFATLLTGIVSALTAILVAIIGRPILAWLAISILVCLSFLLFFGIPGFGLKTTRQRQATPKKAGYRMPVFRPIAIVLVFVMSPAVFCLAYFYQSVTEIVNGLLILSFISTGLSFLMAGVIKEAFLVGYLIAAIYKGFTVDSQIEIVKSIWEHMTAIVKGLGGVTVAGARMAMAAIPWVNQEAIEATVSSFPKLDADTKTKLFGEGGKRLRELAQKGIDCANTITTFYLVLIGFLPVFFLANTILKFHSYSSPDNPLNQPFFITLVCLTLISLPLRAMLGGGETGKKFQLLPLKSQGPRAYFEWILIVAFLVMILNVGWWFLNQTSIAEAAKASFNRQIAVCEIERDLEQLETANVRGTPAYGKYPGTQPVFIKQAQSYNTDADTTVSSQTGAMLNNAKGFLERHQVVDGQLFVIVRLVDEHGVKTGSPVAVPYSQVQFFASDSEVKAKRAELEQTRFPSNVATDFTYDVSQENLKIGYVNPGDVLTVTPTLISKGITWDPSPCVTDGKGVGLAGANRPARSIDNGVQFPAANLRLAALLINVPGYGWSVLDRQRLFTIQQPGNIVISLNDRKGGFDDNQGKVKIEASLRAALNPSQTAKTVTIPCNGEIWNETNINIPPNCTVTFKVTGGYQNGRYGWIGPEGQGGCPGWETGHGPISDTVCMMGLWVKIGSSGEPLPVGRGRTITVNQGGKLFGGVNDDIRTDNVGTYTITVSSLPPSLTIMGGFDDNQGKVKIEASLRAALNPSQTAKTVTIPCNLLWTNTGITVPDSCLLTVQMSGSFLNKGYGNTVTPEGVGACGFDTNNLRICNQFPLAAFGWIGNGSPPMVTPGQSSNAWRIGAEKSLTVLRGGPLYIGCNDDGLWDNQGNWLARITITPLTTL